MMLDYCIAYILAVPVGFLAVGLGMAFVRWTVGEKYSLGDSFRCVDFWIGGTERAVATTLVVWAPSQLPAFIGGWIALKFAANWKRKRDDDPTSATGSLLFLVGNVFSFAVAIAAGLFVHPTALSAWAAR